MFGFRVLFFLAVLATIVVLAFAFVVKKRSPVERVLLALGAISLIWAVVPSARGVGHNGELAIAAAIAFGALVISEKR